MPTLDEQRAARHIGVDAEFDALEVSSPPPPPPPPPPPVPTAPPVAVVGISGHGAGIIGGDGFPILLVTNNNNVGPGSLQAAFEKVADLGGGNISFAKTWGWVQRTGWTQDAYQLGAAQSNMTVAGQTSMSIMGFRKGGFGTGRNVFRFLPGVHNVIFSSVVIRPGKGKKDSDKSISGVGGKDLVFAHLDLGWGTDNTFGMQFPWRSLGKMDDIVNINLFECLMHEPFHPHSTGAALSGSHGWHLNPVTGELESPRHHLHEIDVHRCVFASASHRTPLVKTAGGRIVNNIIYNFQSKAIGLGGPGLPNDIINNLFKGGPQTTTTKRHLRFAYHQGEMEELIEPVHYWEGNTAPNRFFPTVDSDGQRNWTMIKNHTGGSSNPEFGLPIDIGYRREERLPDSPIPLKIVTAQQAYDQIVRGSGVGRAGVHYRIANSGDKVWIHDVEHDRIFKYIRNGTGPSSMGHAPDGGDQDSLFGGFKPMPTPLEPMPELTEDNWPVAVAAKFAPHKPTEIATDGKSYARHYFDGTTPING